MTFDADRLLAHLDHLRQEAGAAIRFVSGMDKDAFLTDSFAQHAVSMCLVNIGEAATRIMDRHAGFAEAHPDIPWQEIRRMRNRVAHGYHDVNFGRVWDTVQAYLPDLLDKLPPSPEP